MTTPDLHQNLGRAWEVAARIEERVSQFLSRLSVRAQQERRSTHEHVVWDEHLCLLAGRSICVGSENVNERYRKVAANGGSVAICAVLYPTVDGPVERCLRVRVGRVTPTFNRSSQTANVVDQLLADSLRAGMPLVTPTKPTDVTGGQGFVAWERDRGIELVDLGRELDSSVAQAWEQLRPLIAER